jgi:glycosyltransferase involved in cell wall biosynthesis
VLLVSHELSLTGAPRLALEIVRKLARSIELRTVSGDGGPLEGPFRELGPVHVLRWWPRTVSGRDHGAGSLAAKGAGRLCAPAIGARLRLWNPDVVYVNSAAAITLLPRLRLGRPPTLLYVHELTMGIERLTGRHRELLRTLPDRYAAVSQAVAEELVQGRGIERARVDVIPPLVDAARIVDLAGGEAARASASRSTPFLVGGTGNPHWTKGIELWLLTARSAVDAMGPDRVMFEWVGVRDNAAGAEFRAMVQKLGLSGNVSLVAETANPYPHYRRFDALAMTSWEESASLVVLEHMALGVPVVCFAGSGGPPEEVGDAGVVVGGFSPSGMAESLCELAGDPERRNLLADRARLRLAAYGPDRVAGIMSDTLREVVALRAARGGTR